MKFKIVSEDDVKVLREAWKVLKKLDRKVNHNTKRTYECLCSHERIMSKGTPSCRSDHSAELTKLDCEYLRLLDELDALHCSVNADSTVSMNT